MRGSFRPNLNKGSGIVRAKRQTPTRPCGGQKQVKGKRAGGAVLCENVFFSCQSDGQAHPASAGISLC